MTSGTTPYNSGQTHIYVINPDGSGLKQLTFGSYEDMPRWSPDRSQIVFVAETLSTSLGSAMWIMNADGSNWRPVKYIPEYSLALTGEYPCWAPDGKKIAFDWCTHCEYGLMIPDIYVMDLTIEVVNQLTYGEGDNGYPIGSNGYPTWSPDGTKIFFNSSRYDSINGTIAGIFSMNPDGSDVQKIIVSSPTIGFHVSASISPDGKKLVFVQGDTSGSALFVSNINGANIIKITDPPIGTSVRLPRWSSDNKRIEFISGSGTGAGIFVVNTDGTNLLKLETGTINAIDSD
jgi:Tol biopolymer transport system component